MSFPVEFIQLQADLKKSLLSRVLFMHFIERLNNEREADSLSLQSFRQTNTFLFRFFVWISNLFLKKESQINFFTSSRVVAWQFIDDTGFLVGEHAQANFDVVIGHQDPGDVADVLRTLYHIGLLTGEHAQANRDAVSKHQAPLSIFEALRILQDAELLTDEQAQVNFNAVSGHQHPDDVANVLRILHHAGLLTGDERAQTNRDVVSGHQNPGSIAVVLSALNDAELLTGDNAQLNFNRIFNYPVLIDCHSYFERIPLQRLTQANWDGIIDLCTANTARPDRGLAELNRHIRTLIGLAPRGAEHIDYQINQQQSTHMASVHASVSESAIRLKDRYLQTVNVRSVLKEITTYINELDEDVLKNQAAKRCIQRLTASDYTFTDPQSEVSIAQIMGLSWMAIHDNSFRIGELDDARASFIEGLYEMQREYNLNEQGEDIGGEDRPSCRSGMFNKFIEKLVGHHPDADIRMITLAQAANKFPIVVQTVTREYLDTQKNSLKTDDFIVLLDQLFESGFSCIWNEIQDTVLIKMMDEFGVLYQNNSERSRLYELLSAHQYMDSSELIEHYKQSATVSLSIAPSFFNKSASEECDDTGMTEDNVSAP